MQVEFVRGGGMGGGIGSILYSDRTMVAGGAEETFTYNGSVGHVVALTSGIGMTTETNRFDAFGNVIGTTGFSLNNRLANTKERDVSIPGVFTLDNHGFRYYNPITGRYISRDPIGYGDGMNAYLYVKNNPINRIDPLGLYDAAGHFYTVYAVARIMRMSHQQSFKLAYNAQMPDQNNHMDAIGTFTSPGAWTRPGDKHREAVQRDLHFLEGATAQQIDNTRENIETSIKGSVMNGRMGSEDGMLSIGVRLHMLGDAYAHTKPDGKGGETGFDAGLGHWQPEMPDSGRETDYLGHSDFNKGKYEKYVNAVCAALGQWRCDKLVTFS